MSVLDETLLGLSLRKWLVVVALSMILTALVDVYNVHPAIAVALGIAVLYPIYGPGKSRNGATNEGPSERGGGQ